VANNSSHTWNDIHPQAPFVVEVPFASATHNSSNIRQLHNTDIVLASSSPMDVMEFYRKPIAAAKPAEIDLVPIGAFDPVYALWPHNRCAGVIFKLNDALALRLDQTGTLNLVDETIHMLYQKHILDTQAACEHMHFYMTCSRRQNVSSMKRCQPHRILRKQRPVSPLVPIWNVTIFSCRPWVFTLMTRPSLLFYCQPSSRKASKWTASWIAWITTTTIIDFGHLAVKHHFYQRYILLLKAAKACNTGRQSMDHACNMLQMIETLKGIFWSINYHGGASIAISAFADMDHLPDFDDVMAHHALLVPHKIPVDQDTSVSYFPNLMRSYPASSM
jgi:hypothetical protein